jgi:hypothetical protein
MARLKPRPFKASATATTTTKATTTTTAITTTKATTTAKTNTGVLRFAQNDDFKSDLKQVATSATASDDLCQHA